MILRHMAASFLIVLALAPPAIAGEVTGQVSTEARAFFNDAAYSGQERDNASVALKAEYYHEWESGSSLTVTPFVRADSADDERTHYDLRELNYMLVRDSWELRVGLSKVFWGATEFVHLVDIINQDDAVESPDGEEKLGQPMVFLSVPGEWGTLDLFVLPYFRERTFPGRSGRLRPAVPVDADKAKYESPDEERHTDLAARYGRSIGGLDFGVYHFRGTAREPTLLPDLSSGSLVLVPYYEQISQTGLDAQLVAGQWLLKFEGIRRTGQGEEFYAGTGGFEFTFSGIWKTAADLGVILEYVNDSRGTGATTPYNNDLMAGLRLAFNDQAGTELLAGLMEDLEYHTRIASIEASRRIGDSLKVNIEARSFVDVHSDDLVYDIRDDDYVLAELVKYF